MDGILSNGASRHLGLLDSDTMERKRFVDDYIIQVRVMGFEVLEITMCMIL